MNIEFGESIKKIIFINFFFVLFVKFEYWILFQLDYFVTIIHFFTSKQKTPFFCSIIVQKYSIHSKTIINFTKKDKTLKQSV